MGDTFIRVLVMLREVPPAPRGIDTLTLQSRLAEQGFEVDLRTIQRDLSRFSTVLALHCDDRARPYRWCYGSDRAASGNPLVAPARALALMLLDRHLGALLPPSIRAHLQGELASAAAMIGAGPAAAAAPLSSWLGKVAAVPRGPRMLPPELAPGVLDAVAEALFRDRQLCIRYQGREAARPRWWEVSPLGLVARGPVLVLVACFSDTQAPRQFVLHRATAARLMDTPVDRPPGFSLAAYAADGAFGRRVSEHGPDSTIAFRARFDRANAAQVLETPLADDQHITPTDDGFLVGATVNDTYEFRAWLLGLGDLVEVLAPESLRIALGETLARAAALYASKT